MTMIMQFTGLSGMPQINASQILGVLGNVAFLFIGAGVIFVITAVILYLMKFRVPLFLLVQTGKGIRLKKDKGYLDLKKQEFRALKHKKVHYKIPLSEDYVFDGKKDLLFGYIKDNSCTWLQVTENPHFKPADIDMLSFQAEMFARIDEATKMKLKFWDKYGHQIIWAFTIVIFMICIILILKSVDKAIEMGNAAAGAHAQQVQNLALVPLLSVKKVRTWLIGNYL